MKILSITKKELLSFFRDKSTFIIFLIPILLLPIYSVGMNYICKTNTDEINLCFCTDSEISREIFDSFKLAANDYQINEISSMDENKLLQTKKIDFIIKITRNNIDIICNSKSFNSISKALKVGEQFQQFYLSKIIDSNKPYSFILKNEHNKEFNPTDNITNSLTPIIFVLLCFQSILGFSNDIFSGEKERNTLELLYLSNVSKKDLYYGKVLSLLTISVINVLICITTYLISDKSHRLGVISVVYMTIIMLMFSIISSTISSTVSLRAKSIKSSQSINELLLSFPLFSIAGLSLGFINKDSHFIHSIPITNLQCDLLNIFYNEFRPIDFFLDLPSNILLIFILSFINVRYMKSEKVFI